MNITNPTTFGSPALVYSTSNSSGTGGALRADDTLAIFSSTVPTNISTSTVSASTGDNAFGSREDHVHGSTAITAIASEAEMVAASSTTTAASPGRTQNHPGVGKARCSLNALGTLVSGGYNVTGTSKTATGVYTITVGTDFANTEYQTTFVPWNTTIAAHVVRVDEAGKAAGVVTVQVFDGDDSPGNEGMDFVCFGTQ